ncbi:Exopolygalacturonase X-1 [Colletotrichum sp. SAR 10_65]|nr:Exopolygalacturonase X-1 [Colletotrichum sp. SAR 10_65]KAI8215806.1 Exopolygalacturonase X-1 [Colletotrichum sp. SAR 10_76]KAJ5001589.1 Exopolygalacturonase X-1 [Colletotrichum sp. SAR 10_66]
MHKKYGPIVRINPYELHIIDPEFYDELYSSNRKSDKYRWWTNLAGADGSSFSTVPHDLHRLRRGALNPFFSVRSVTQLEPLIRSKVEKLSARFGEIAQTGEVVRLDAAFMALTMDIICDYAFANDRKYLDEPDFKLVWKETIIGAFEGGAVGRQFPWMLPVMKRLPFDLPPEEKTLQRLCDEAEILTGAGSETTAQTLTRILFYLNLAYAELYLATATVIRRFDWEMFETTLDDVVSMRSLALSLLAAASALLPVSSAASVASPKPSLPERPHVVPAPYNTGRDMPHSPPREKGRYCYVKPGCGEKRDDAPKILDAFKKCNDGGTVVFDKSYLIGSPLDLTFLKHIDVVITGSIEFNDDPYYWAENSFKFAFQNQSVFWKLGGEDINIYGDLSNDQSVIDGRGQAYWVAIQTNSSLLRPMLFSFEGVKGATMSHLRMRNPPNWFNLIANSTDVLISNMDLRAESTNGTKIANSDGWDTYRSDRVVIQDSYIINTDDCVSFKPNSTNVVIQNLDCTGSHGISVGSLGQYKGETDIVENLYIYNITMADASDAARIKVWPGIESSFQTLLNGGGGLGRVRNVTYDLFKNINNDRAITITQCYGQKNQTLCEEHPANLTITDITLKNIYGTTSAKLDPQAGTLVCSAPDRCSNIRAENVTVTVPSGKPPVYECKNLDNNLLQINCTSGTDGERDNTNG